MFVAWSVACSWAIAGSRDEAKEGERRRRRDLDAKRQKHAQKGPI